MDSEIFIQVIVPLRLEWTPCYRGPANLVPGQRVTVFFAHRQYVGVVWRTGVTPEVDASRVLSITRVEEDLPQVSAEEIRFWEFLSSYYLCTIGEVYKAAYPASKIRSEQIGAGILERLRQRLAVREESLKKKHKDNVRERLEQERDVILSQIESLTRAGSAPVKLSAQKPSKPLLLAGGDRTPEYLNLCRGALERGENVLVITPEIAAGEQLGKVLEEAFPALVHIVSSHMTDARRRAVARDVRSFGGQVVVGTRSALFLPLSRLGLIIVDNEQDVLLKQIEPAPRYNARDAAVMLGRIHSAAVVLGTPSPSLESLHNAQTGKYDSRRTDNPRAPLSVIDVSAEKRKNGMVDMFSRKLIDTIMSSEGPIALIRGWEKPEDLTMRIADLFPGREVDVFTLQQARLTDLARYAVVALLQADALMRAGDFRADERILQVVAGLREESKGTLVVQTAKSDHPVFGDPEEVYARLLEERRAFSLPPFTRIVDIETAGQKERTVLLPDNTLATKKKSIMDRAFALEKKSNGRVRTIIDVDPV